MDDFNVDTSSYPKPNNLPVNPLAVAGQVGDLLQKQQQLQSGALGINQQKLDLYNKHFQIMNNEISNLANDPETTVGEVIKRIHSLGDAFDMPQPIKDQAEGEFKGITSDPLGKNGAGNPALSRQLDLVLKRGMDMSQRLNSQYGANTPVDNGTSVTPGRTYLRGGPVPTGAPIATQPPVSQQEYDTDPNSPTYNRLKFRGSTPPQIPAGTLPVQGGFPGQYQPLGAPSTTAPASAPSLPVQPPAPVYPPASSIQPSANPAFASQPAPVKDQSQVPQPAGGAASLPPLFKEGSEKLTADQATATQKATGMKPAVDALNLMNDVRSGPGTASWNHAVAFIKANFPDLLPTDGEKDPTVVYQVISKLMHQYLKVSGSRSDADLANLEAGTPNVGTMIAPALIKSTRDQIARDAIEIARPIGFSGRKDLENYGNYSAQFPNSMDERAFTMDTLPMNERAKMFNTMLAKAKKGDPEGIKFIKSLDMANKVYNGGQ